MPWVIYVQSSSIYLLYRLLNDYDFNEIKYIFIIKVSDRWIVINTRLFTNFSFSSCPIILCNCIADLKNSMVTQKMRKLLLKNNIISIELSFVSALNVNKTTPLTKANKYHDVFCVGSISFDNKKKITNILIFKLLEVCFHVIWIK